MSKNENDKFAKERILDIAEELFSRQGYHAVSVRQITSAAKCNLAAVNYHFGNKKNLYIEVFRSRWIPRANSLHNRFLEHLSCQGFNSAEDVLHAFIEAFIEGPLTADESMRHHQLIARELAKPTGVIEIVADEIQRPFFDELIRHLKCYLPEEEDENSWILKVLSIFSMALFFNFARPMVTYITGCEYDKAFRHLLVEHISTFCTQGLGIKARQERLK